MTSAKRINLALLWLALLGIAGWWIGPRLQLSGDLRKFMPARGIPRRRRSADAARAAGGTEAPICTFSAAQAGI